MARHRTATNQPSLGLEDPSRQRPFLSDYDMSHMVCPSTILYSHRSTENRKKEAEMRLWWLLWLPAALSLSSAAWKSLRVARGGGMTMSIQGEYNKRAIKGMGILAGTGVLETGYLTWVKYANVPVLCTGNEESSSCMDVITSPYSTIPFVDIPLSTVAVLGYFSVMVMSLLQVYNSKNDENDSIVGPALLFVATAMGTFSTYLMTILTFILNKDCMYCYISAFLSLSIATLAWFTRIVPNKTKAFTVSSTSILLTTISSVFLFYVTSIITVSDTVQAKVIPGINGGVIGESQYKSAREINEDVKMPPPLTKHSSSAALAVSDKLKSLNAKMYGAYWCSHCFNQKQNLGLEAAHNFEYIECDKEGFNSQFPMCKSKKIPGYPTWEINGKLYPGEKSVEELETLLNSLD